jgi:acetylornithine deacetylase/succinyl-diaminopimelate desuccinylase-like protein
MARMTFIAIITLTAILQNSPAPAGLLEDVRGISSATTNEGRFDAIASLLKARGLTFTVEPFTIDKPRGREPRTEGRNIVVTLGQGPSDIVIGAHYDAVRLPDGTLSRGAVDNAASSVLLVRLAETLRAEKLSSRVRIVWFDMEELGLIGSAQYVKQHAGDRVLSMLNFDVNGYGDTILFGPSQRKEGAALRRTVVETCAVEDVACVAFAQMPPGDDRSFVAAGIPTVSLAILPAVEAHQLWLMMNAGANAGLAPGTTPAVLRTLHTPEDTIEKLNADSMARMLRFALALVRGIARQ